jgi:outer membrane protein OmpA-like peptidoglycan-associated protein
MFNALRVRPEAFEFDPELDEYERGWGQDEGLFDEYETPARPGACPPYERGEVAKSRTQQGHLPADVINHPRGLLIADFGVDWRTPKSTLRSDATLRAWVATMVDVIRANPSTRIRISGYSDCVGRERNNAFLRRGRALRVKQLLQQIAGPRWSVIAPRIVFTGAAPAGDYIADNASVTGRAQNRGVLISHVRDVPMEPDVITTRAPVGPCGFRPSRHGFKFANLFTLPSSITSALSTLGIPVGSGQYGLCGGMSFLAADYFSAGRPIPTTPTAPGMTSGLYLKLVERQLDSLKLKPILLRLNPGVPLPSIPMPRPGFAAPVIKFWRWMGLRDRERGSIAEKTASEIPAINALLRRGKFSVFGLVLVDRSGALTDNHQILAYCMIQPGPGQFEYAIYDPNYPSRDDIRIEVKITGREAEAFHVVPGGTRTRIRGIFNMAYSPVRP